jgi:hypothetical protein
MIVRILSWYKKGSDAKEESLCGAEPLKIGPSLPLKTRKTKKKIRVY